MVYKKKKEIKTKKKKKNSITCNTSHMKKKEGFKLFDILSKDRERDCNNILLSLVLQ